MSKVKLDYGTRTFVFLEGAPHPVESIDDPAESEFHPFFQMTEIQCHSIDDACKRLVNVTDDACEALKQLLRNYPDLFT